MRERYPKLRTENSMSTPCNAETPRRRENRLWSSSASRRLGVEKSARVAMAILAAITTACRQDMQDQPKYIPLRPSSFFADGRSARPIPEGTVARGQLRSDKVFYTGKSGDTFVDKLPFPVTRQVLERGHERFNIYCTPCHRPLGNRLGIVV